MIYGRVFAAKGQLDRRRLVMWKFVIFRLAQAQRNLALYLARHIFPATWDLGRACNDLPDGTSRKLPARSLLQIGTTRRLPLPEVSRRLRLLQRDAGA